MEGISGYAKSGDAHLAYIITGSGPLDVLYTGGFTVSIDSCDEEPHVAHVLRRLAAFSRLIRFDARGIGLSDPIDPARPLSIESMVADTLAVLDAAGSREVRIVGDSGAGGAAIELAATRPDLVRGLVLVNSAARYIQGDDYPYGLQAEVLEQFLAENTDPDTEWSVGDADDLALLVPSLRNDQRFREWWVRAARRGASPATARAIIGCNSRADLRHRLPEVQVPTLILHSVNNAFVDIEQGRYLARNIPGARLVELPGADSAMWGLEADMYLDEIEEFFTGHRTGRAERILATVVFTDIVDSTGQAAALGDRAWRAVLENHDAIIRRELLRYSGREVNTTGDGFLAAFESPTQAVRCARAIIDESAQAGIKVRAGIHTGECEQRNDDLAGLAVHIAARVAAAAGSGEVVVSRTVRDLVGGSGARFADRGEHDLKGVPERWQLFSLES